MPARSGSSNNNKTSLHIKLPNSSSVTRPSPSACLSSRKALPAGSSDSIKVRPKSKDTVGLLVSPRPGKPTVTISSPTTQRSTEDSMHEGSKVRQLKGKLKDLAAEQRAYCSAGTSGAANLVSVSSCRSENYYELKSSVEPGSDAYTALFMNTTDNMNATEVSSTKQQSKCGTSGEEGGVSLKQRLAMLKTRIKAAFDNGSTCIKVLREKLKMHPADNI